MWKKLNFPKFRYNNRRLPKKGHIIYFSALRQITYNCLYRLFTEKYIYFPFSTKPNEIKRNETDRNETKRNQTKRNETTLHFVSFDFVSFRSISFRFVSISFRTLQVPYFVYVSVHPFVRPQRFPDIT
jgi:hypothetical protein